MSVLADRRLAPSRRRGVPGAAVSAWILPVSDTAALGTALPLAQVPLGRGLLYAAAVLLLLAADGGHRQRICLRVSDQVPRLAAVAAVPLVLLLPGGPGQAVSTGVWSIGLLVVFRALACTALRAAHRRGACVQRALVVGSDPLATRIRRALSEHPEYGLTVWACVDRRAASDASGGEVRPASGDPDQLAELVGQYGISRVLVGFSATHDGELVALLRSCRGLPVDVCLVPRLHELGMAVPRGHLDELWGIPLVPLRRPSRVASVAKRGFDLVTGAVLLVLVAPLLCVLAVATGACHGRPLFRQPRLTRGGRRAEVLKLRTVRDSAGSWAVGPDQCDRLGRWLRATHLDELPQLLNVLRGEMSLVGPRPERPYYAARFAAEIAEYADRHRVAGGVTGWAQVNGLHGDTSIVDRARFDNQYIEYWTLWMDVVIVVRTAGIVLARIARSANVADTRREERR